MNLFSLVKLWLVFVCTFFLLGKVNSALVNPISDSGTQPQLPLTYYFNVTLNYSQISIVFNYTNWADIDWHLYYVPSNTLACKSTNPDNTTCQSQLYTVVNSKCVLCSSLLSRCKLCSDQNTCVECINSQFQINASNKCVCATGTWQVTNICINITGCISASLVNGVKLCNFCDISKHFELSSINNNCTCKIGYFFNTTTKLCEQFCGDGIIINGQCDDNNTQNDDGCSSVCKIQPGFTCNYKINKSVCYYSHNLVFQFVNIYKVVGKNQGQIYLKLNSNNNFIAQRLYSISFQPVIKANITNFLNVTGFQVQKDNVLVINVKYNKTLQLNYMQLEMSFNNTLFISEQQILHIYCKGKNFPLVISAYYEKYEQISKFSYAFGIVVYAVVLIIILSPKLIGVQTITTVQLVFFSQLLIFNSNDWPSAFMTLYPLKLSTGYNQFKKNQLFYSENQQFIKFRYLSFQPNFIQNNFSNFSILIVLSIIFLIIFCIQNSQITEYSLLKQKKQIKQNKKKLFYLLKVSKTMYNTLFHFCMVILLQVLASLVIETLGLSKKQTLSQPLYILNKLSIFFTLFILIFVIFNNFLNLLLDQSQIRQWNFKYGKHQNRYIQIFILYIFSTGILLFCFNTYQIKGVLFAYMPFVLSVVYGLFLIGYRPYRYTLFIHQISIIINQSIVILSFGVISLKNLIPSISQYYFLIYSYANLSLCTICLIISIIRFIYQCKYGVQIMEKQKNDEESQKYRKLYEKRQKQKKSIQSLIQSKQLKMIKMRKKNEYLMQNQILEEEQINFLNWLKQKTYLSKYQRDLLYFEKYENKPIKWLQIYQKQEYIKIKNKKQQKNKNLHPEDDEQLQNIKAQLRKSLKYKHLKVESSPQKSKSKHQINSQPKKTKVVKLEQNSKKNYEQKKNFRKTSFSQQKQIKIRKNSNDLNDLKRPFINQKPPLNKKREKSSEKKRQFEKQQKNKQSDTSKSKKRKQKKY